MTPEQARAVDWICPQCALEHGAKTYPGHLATFHTGVCGCCGETKTVTEPRDFDWRGVGRRV